MLWNSGQGEGLWGLWVFTTQHLDFRLDHLILICFSPCLLPVLDALSWNFSKCIFADTESLYSYRSGDGELEVSNCSLYRFSASFPVLSSMPLSSLWPDNCKILH